ncbi:MAG TPA: LysR family transcriptional regulator [Magnetospirillaceae bacterium]
MNWDDLRIFLAVARAGTLGKAARKLGQSQPTMGRRLKALEEAVGQALFQRTAEGFVLTDEGAAVLAHAERIEEEALAFERELEGQDQGLDGALRLSSSDWFGIHMLTPVLADFAGQHPRVSVELLTDMRLYSLSRREADMVFRIQAFDEPDVIARRLMDIPYGLYQKKGAEPPRIGYGRGAALITMDVGFGEMPDAVWLAKMFPQARAVSRSNNRDVQARLCAQGVGLAVLPRPLGDAAQGIERVDLGEEPPSRTTWVGYHRDLKRLARLRALLDLVIEWLAN